jgi:hypothetical protein
MIYLWLEFLEDFCHNGKSFQLGFSSKKKVTNSFIISLSVSDFMIGLFVMPLSAAFILLDKWRLGLVVCKWHTRLERLIFGLKPFLFILGYF